MSEPSNEALEAAADYYDPVYEAAQYEALAKRFDAYAAARVAEARAQEREACTEIARHPGFIQAQDTDWDLGVEYAKEYIARAIEERP